MDSEVVELDKCGEGVVTEIFKTAEGIGYALYKRVI